MSNIDRQRVAAVRKLEAKGYTFATGEWMAPADDAAPPPITDALHSPCRRARGLHRRLRGGARARRHHPTLSTPTKLCGGLAARCRAERGDRR